MNETLALLMRAAEGLGLEDAAQRPNSMGLRDLTQFVLAAEAAFALHLPDEAVWDYATLGDMARDIDARLADRKDGQRPTDAQRQDWYYQ